MPNLWIEEKLVDRTNECRFGDSGPYESFTDDLSRLFKSLRIDYGRPSKMYIDSKTLDDSIHVGYVFLKRMPYEDDRSKTYLQESWVTIYEVCAQDDPRALIWNAGCKPGELEEDESLRQLDIEEAQKLARRKKAA